MDEILSGFDYLTYYFYLLYYKFIGYPIVVRICIAVVTLCVVFYLFLALYLAYGIYRRQREKKSFQRIYDRFYEPLRRDSALSLRQLPPDGDQPVRLCGRAVYEKCEVQLRPFQETYRTGNADDG